MMAAGYPRHKATLEERWTTVKHNCDWPSVSTLTGKTWHHEVASFDDLVNFVYERTEGRFFFEHRGIRFEDEQDAVLFKLAYNAQFKG